MALYSATGIVLRRIPLGEKDKIITLFTRERGKVRAVAKGARKTTSKLSGGSEPLMLVKGLFSEGKSLDVMSQVEVRESFLILRSDYDRYLRATYACELLDNLTEENDPEEEAFELLLSTLYVLQRAVMPDLALHAYELKLLALVGYEPQISRCVGCESEWGEFVWPLSFSPGLGGVLCEICAKAARDETVPCPPKATWILEKLAGTLDPKALAALTTEPEVLALVNRALRAHLRLRLERVVKSTEFLDALRLTESGGSAAPASG